MFDIAFSELLVIALVALVVIGPEKLPRVARTLGLLAGRLQRYVSAVRADVERELHARDFQNLRQDIAHGVRTAEDALTQQARQVEQAITSATHPDAPQSSAGTAQDGTRAP